MICITCRPVITQSKRSISEHHVKRANGPQLWLALEDTWLLQVLFTTHTLRLFRGLRALLFGRPTDIALISCRTLVRIDKTMSLTYHRAVY